jgi:hypothetical protein
VVPSRAYLLSCLSFGYFSSYPSRYGRNSRRPYLLVCCMPCWPPCAKFDWASQVAQHQVRIVSFIHECWHISPSTCAQLARMFLAHSDSVAAACGHSRYGAVRYLLPQGVFFIDQQFLIGQPSVVRQRVIISDFNLLPPPCTSIVLDSRQHFRAALHQSIRGH